MNREKLSAMSIFNSFQNEYKSISYFIWNNLSIYVNSFAIDPKFIFLGILAKNMHFYYI